MIEKAKAAAGATSCEAVVELALRDLVQSQRRKYPTELAGRVQLLQEFDHKDLRARMAEGYAAEAANPSLGADWTEADLDGIG